MAITIPTANLLLDKRRELQSDKYPVKLVVYYLGSKKRYGLPFSFSENEWKKICSKNLRDQDLKESRAQLNYYKEEKFSNTLKQITGIFTFDKFEKIYFGQTPMTRVKSDSVYELFDSMISEMFRQGNVGNSAIYKTAKNSLINYKSKLKFSDVDLDFLKGYEKYMVSIHKSQAYIAINIRCLRAVYYQGIRLGIVDEKDFPFSRQKIAPGKYKIKTGRTFKRSLSVEQLKLLIKPKLRSPSRQKALDFWLFSFYGNGMNVKDICLLKYGNIKGDYIEFYRAKTQETQQDIIKIRFKTNEHIKNVIRTYGNKKKQAVNYVFNILEKDDSPIIVRKKVQNFTKVINKHMKAISKELDFDFAITTQYARHSFSYHVYKKGVSLDELGEALGHSSTLTTKNYIDYIGDDLSEKISSILETI